MLNYLTIPSRQLDELFARQVVGLRPAREFELRDYWYDKQGLPRFLELPFYSTSLEAVLPIAERHFESIHWVPAKKKFEGVWKGGELFCEVGVPLPRALCAALLNIQNRTLLSYAPARYTAEV